MNFVMLMKGVSWERLVMYIAVTSWENQTNVR